MGIIRPTIKSILRPALNPVLRGISGTITRFFTEFDEVAQSYIIFDSPIILTGDFMINVKLVLRDGVNYIFGNSMDFNSRISIFANGGGSVRDNFGDVLSINVGELKKFLGYLISLNLERIGNTLTLYVNGNIITSGTLSPISIFNIDQLCRNSNSVNPVKTYELFKIIDNGTTVLDMPIDQNYTPTNNTVIDKASGNNGTFVNVAEGDSTRYTLENGQWVDSSGNVLEMA